MKLSQIKPPFGLLDDHISNCHQLACIGYVHQVYLVSFSVTQKLSFQCLNTSFLISLSLFLMKTRLPKIAISMSKHLALSSSVLLNLSAIPFCCGISGIVSFCRMPASKQYLLNCSERNSFALSCPSFLGVPTLRTILFRLASASPFALNKFINTNFVYWSANTMQNGNPDSELLRKVPSRLWTPSPASLLLGSLPVLVQQSL